MATAITNRSIEWSPVLGGTIVACAITLVLVPFGHALGLSFTNLQSDDMVTPHSLLAFGLWVLWTQISSSIAGGYLAGRMITLGDNTQAGELRDGAHGLLVWGLSSVLTALAIGAAAAFAALVTTPEQADAAIGLSAEMEKKVAILSAFALGASSAVSAVAAWIMATIGGDHRDRKTDTTRYIRSYRTSTSKR